MSKSKSNIHYEFINANDNKSIEQILRKMLVDKLRASEANKR